MPTLNPVDAGATVSGIWTYGTKRRWGGVDLATEVDVPVRVDAIISVSGECGHGL